MATVNDICQGGLRLIGIRDFSDTDRQEEAIDMLNTMLTSWRKWLHPTLTEDTHTLSAGTESYTIGSGQTIDTVRPINIVSAFIRDSSGYDHDVAVNLTKKEYDDVYDKDASSRPNKLYYDKGTTAGTIYFDTAPSAAETLYLYSVKPFTEYSATTDTFLLPVEYEQMVRYNFAIMIAPEYSIQPLDIVYVKAQELLMEIANENFKVPESKIDTALL